MPQVIGLIMCSCCKGDVVVCWFSSARLSLSAKRLVLLLFASEHANEVLLL